MFFNDPVTQNDTFYFNIGYNVPFSLRPSQCIGQTPAFMIDTQATPPLCSSIAGGVGGSSTAFDLIDSSNPSLGWLYTYSSSNLSSICSLNGGR